MSPKFAVIAEGPTDFTVLRQILARVFEDADLVVAQIQPALDATSGRSEPGGWYEVFRCVGSDRLLGAFDHSDFVVVQIDTDVCEEPHFGVSRRAPDGRERSVDEMVALTRERLIREIAPEVYERFRDRIIFAIAVESIECWLLPLYYESNGRRGKTVNCLGTLNQWLNKHEGFSIDPEKSDAVRYYVKIVKQFRKRKDVEDASTHNPSFTRFIEALRTIQSGSEDPAQPNR